jgi:hypothetical protein
MEALWKTRGRTTQKLSEALGVVGVWKSEAYADGEVWYEFARDRYKQPRLLAHVMGIVECELVDWKRKQGCGPSCCRKSHSPVYTEQRRPSRIVFEHDLLKR